jgi:16S rRNA (adenine1518-N6/adenine1519-N6)-dimethyltransferase
MKAKKSLGQNFLHSKKILGDITGAADIQSDDTILEVGPGKGALTQGLLASARRVVAVEKDDRMIPELEEKFAEEIMEGKLEIIHGDILEFKNESADLASREYKIVANIPYYITGTFLRKFLTAENPPSRMVLMLQKEVARRIVASDKKESLLSISVKAYGKPRYIKTVPARYFSPAPKVDSAILLIDEISKKFFRDNKIAEEKFFEILRAGFAHKRKYLISNLKDTAPLRGAVSLQEKFIKCGIPEKARAEDLSLEDWKCLIS